MLELVHTIKTWIEKHIQTIEMQVIFMMIVVF